MHAQRRRRGTHLGLDGEAALLREVHKVHHARAQVGEGRDGLHLDRVHLLERVVEHSRRVDDLPAQVLVVHVPNEERLGREGVRLHVDVGARHLVDERRLAHVRVAADEERARRRVDRRQTRHVLADLLEVRQRVLLPLHDGRHATERRLLELLAPVQGVAELDEAAVVLADLDNQVARRIDLTERELVVVLVVQDVEQRAQEGVQVLRRMRARVSDHVLLCATGSRWKDSRRTSMTGNSVRI